MANITNFHIPRPGVYYRLEPGCWYVSEYLNHVHNPPEGGPSLCSYEKISTRALIDANYDTIQYILDPTPQAAYHTYWEPLYGVDDVYDLRLVYGVIDSLTFWTWLEGMTHHLDHQRSMTLVRITTNKNLPFVEDYIRGKRELPQPPIDAQGAGAMEYVPSVSDIVEIEMMRTTTTDMIAFFRWLGY